MKQSLIELLPDDIISRDFEAEFLKYSSYSDYTVATGDNEFMLTIINYSTLYAKQIEIEWFVVILITVFCLLQEWESLTWKLL